MPEEDGAGTGGEIKISEITAEDVYSLWPPQDMVEPQKVPDEVKRKLGWKTCVHAIQTDPNCILPLAPFMNSGLG